MYTCEYCGKVFDSFDDAFEHENRHLTNVYGTVDEWNFDDQKRTMLRDSGFEFCEYSSEYAEPEAVFVRFQYKDKDGSARLDDTWRTMYKVVRYTRAKNQDKAAYLENLINDHTNEQ
jgi:hypothetical protein